MKDNSRAIVPVGQRGVVVAVARQIAITEKVLDISQRRKIENIKILIHKLCHTTVWEDRELAWLTLRKMGPIHSSWAELLQSAIYSGDGWARIFASESLSMYGCLPNDTIPVFIEVIESGIDLCSFDWVRIACSAIGKYKDISDECVRVAIPPLIKALRCPDINVSLYASETLCNFGQFFSNDVQLSNIKKHLGNVTKADSRRNELLQIARNRLLSLVEADTA